MRNCLLCIAALAIFGCGKKKASPQEKSPDSSSGRATKRATEPAHESGQQGQGASGVQPYFTFPIKNLGALYECTSPKTPKRFLFTFPLKGQGRVTLRHIHDNSVFLIDCKPPTQKPSHALISCTVDKVDVVLSILEDSTAALSTTKRDGTLTATDYRCYHFPALFPATMTSPPRIAACSFAAGKITLYVAQVPGEEYASVALASKQKGARFSARALRVPIKAEADGMGLATTLSDKGERYPISIRIWWSQGGVAVSGQVGRGHFPKQACHRFLLPHK